MYGGATHRRDKKDGSQADELARITQLRALIGSERRSWTRTTVTDSLALPSQRRLAKLNEIAIWKLIAGLFGRSPSHFHPYVPTRAIANLHRLRILLRSRPPTAAALPLTPFELGRNLNLWYLCRRDLRIARRCFRDLLPPRAWIFKHPGLGDAWTMKRWDLIF